ncbi:MAG TPA: hypothetical protein VJ259_00700, partial [Actinomycetota bacterium]|nr:hypothetical protein [Actinomycetota bacterium]
RSYGTGQMRLYEDCVSRILVFREIFRQVVSGVDAFADAGTPPGPVAADPPTGLTDAAPPLSGLALSGPNFTSGGVTYVSGTTQLVITSDDNYWTKPDLQVLVRTFPAGSPAPAYGPGVPADPAPFSLTGPDGERVVQFRGIDGRGTCNVEAERTRNFTLDNTPPDITITSPPAGTVFDTDDFSSIQYSVTDPGSGVASDSVTLDGMPATNGQVLDMFFLDPGTHTIQVTATDNLGNVGTADRTFEVHATAESLISNVDRAFGLGLITDPAVYEGLRDKLEAALRSHNRGQHAVEHNQLSAFINQLMAQRGNGIDAATADRFIAYAQDLIARNG